MPVHGTAQFATAGSGLFFNPCSMSSTIGTTKYCWAQCSSSCDVILQVSRRFRKRLYSWIVSVMLPIYMYLSSPGMVAGSGRTVMKAVEPIRRRLFSKNVGMQLPSFIIVAFNGNQKRHDQNCWYPDRIVLSSAVGPIHSNSILRPGEHYRVRSTCLYQKMSCLRA